jgi:Icc-related predicted phosphoesterase
MAFLRRKGDSAFSLFFATDLHGSEKCFRKFLKAAAFYNVDALVLGGDLTGKLMVPIVARPDGSHTAHFLDKEVIARTTQELNELESNIRFNGHYVYRCTPQELTLLSGDKERRKERFQMVIRQDLTRWMERADVQLGEHPVPCLGIPGNDDEDFVGDILSGSKTIENGEDHILALGPFQVLSCGYSNPTPWNSPRELSEEELGERLETAAGELEPDRPTIFNVHVPPYDSGLDLAPEIAQDLRLKGGATASMKPVGSTATAELIARVQPVVSLHGHVHESRGSAKLGRSLALNPGSEYNVGVLRGVIVKLTADRATSYQFVSA